MKYFLVKKGLPVGSLQLKDTAGNVLVNNVAVNGTANLVIPFNGQITLGVRNTIGAFINGAHRVVWKILNAAGAVLREGTGLEVDTNNLSIAQIARIAIILDSAAEKSVNVSVSPPPGYQEEQIWISDWQWQELVANPDGSNPHWEDRVTPGHWLTAVLPTARSAAPGPWTLEAMATNPLGYYTANPVQFLGMLPDWNLKPLVTSGYWDDWSMPDKTSFDFALAAQTAADVARPWPTTIPKPDAIRAAGIVAVLVFVLEITKYLDFSYIVYEKVSRTNPTLSYFGRSAGRGSPELVRFRRDSYHERNLDHFPSRLRASVETRGFSDYAEWAVRGREQQMIDSIGGLISDGAGGRATNFIRGVSKINPRGYSFWLTSNHAFGQIHAFTGYPLLEFGAVPPMTTPYSTVIYKQIYP